MSQSARRQGWLSAISDWASRQGHASLFKTHLAKPWRTVNNQPFTRLLGSTRVENRSHSCRAARWSRKPFDVIAETAQFADHLARPHLLRFFADGWSAFLTANALVKNLPNQTTQPVV